MTCLCVGQLFSFTVMESSLHFSKKVLWESLRSLYHLKNKSGYHLAMIKSCMILHGPASERKVYTFILLELQTYEIRSTRKLHNKNIRVSCFHGGKQEVVILTRGTTNALTKAHLLATTRFYGCLQFELLGPIMQRQDIYKFVLPAKSDDDWPCSSQESGQ